MELRLRIERRNAKFTEGRSISLRASYLSAISDGELRGQHSVKIARHYRPPLAHFFNNLLGERPGEGELWKTHLTSDHSAATAIACLSPGMVKPSLSSLAIMSLPAFSSISTSGGRTGVHAESLP
jgi:hypothetical protein